MSMLQKLQRKTLVWTQIVGYAVTLFVGTLIGLVVLQFYADVTPALEDQTDVFAEDASVVSKIPPSDESLIWDHSLLEFSPEEIKELESKPYVASVSEFQVATFKVFATIGGRNLGMSTAMFLESIPSEYMDVDTAQWSFEPGDAFVPIVVPEDYLNLFNLGFAQSQGLRRNPIWGHEMAHRFKRLRPREFQVFCESNYRFFNQSQFHLGAAGISDLGKCGIRKCSRKKAQSSFGQVFRSRCSTNCD